MGVHGDVLDKYFGTKKIGFVGYLSGELYEIEFGIFL